MCMSLLQLQVTVEHFVPGQTLFRELLHEGIGVELLNVIYTGFAPLAFEEHHSTNHSGHTCSVAYALSTHLFVGSLVAAVVVDVVSEGFAFFVCTTDAATD